jgi:hypothetical protein
VKHYQSPERIAKHSPGPRPKEAQAPMTTTPTIRDNAPEVPPGPGQESPHGCYDGFVYLGFETEEDGELVEITDRVPCRRCTDVSS